MKNFKFKNLLAAFLLTLIISANSHGQSDLTLTANDQSKKSPRMQVQMGHVNDIKNLKFSSDEKKIISYAEKGTFTIGGTIIIWDIRTRRIIMQIPNKIFMDVTPNNEFACFDEKTNEIEFWDLPTCSIKYTIKRTTQIFPSYADISIDGKLLVAGNGSRFFIMEIPTGKVLHEVEVYKTINGKDELIQQIGFNPDNTTVTYTTFHGNGYTYTITAKRIDVILAKGDYNYECRFSFEPGGKKRIITSKSTINLYDIENGNITKSGSLSLYDSLKNKDGQIAFSTFSNDGQYFLIGILFGPSFLFKTENMKLIQKIDVKNSTAGMFSSDNKYFVIAENTGINTYSIDGLLVNKLEKYIKRLSKLNFCEEKQLLCASSSLDIQLWNMKELKLEFTQPDYNDGIVSPKGNYLAAYDNYTVPNGKWNGKGLVVDLSNKKTLINFTVNDFIRAITFTYNDKSFIFKGNDGIWNVDLATKKYTQVETGIVHNAGGHDVFCTNPVKNEIVLFGRLKEVTYCDLNKSKFKQKEISGVNEFNNHSIYDIVVSPLGDQFAFTHTDNNKHYKFCISDWNSSKFKVLAEPEAHYEGMGYSSDGTKLAIPANPFFVVDIKSEKRIKTFSELNDAVTGLIFMKNDKIIVSSSYDGTIKFWDYEKEKEIVTLLPSDKANEYIFVTTDGYYKTTKYGANAIHYVLGDKIITFDQLDLKFNRPDIVFQKLGADNSVVTAYHQAYLKRLKKMGFTEKDIEGDLNLPEMELLTKEIPAFTDNKQFSFSVKAKDSKYELNRINVYVNDVPVFGQQGIELQSQHVKEIEQNINLELSNGINKIQVSALNSSGVESFRESIIINYTGEKAKPSLYLVAIGISDYLNPFYNLTYAAKDAQDIEKLVKEHKNNYQEVITIPLLNQNAITKNISNAKQTLKNSKPDDVVIVFVASHGLLDDKLDYYIGTHNCDFKNPSVNGLPYDKLEDLLDGIPARNKLLLIDACHSGEVDKDEDTTSVAVNANTNVKSRGFKPVDSGISNINTPAVNTDKKTIGLKNSFELMNEIFADVRKGTGAVVIASAGGKEYAFESPEWNNGVFTYCLLEGIKSKNADINKDGKIVVSEIREYVSKKVQELTDGKQNPASRIENLENDFVIW